MKIYFPFSRAAHHIVCVFNIFNKEKMSKRKISGVVLIIMRLAVYVVFGESI